MAPERLNSLAVEEPESLLSSAPAQVSGPYPLTYAQESLWLFEQLSPGTPTYSIPEGWLLHGRIETTLLQRSLDQIVLRHETLRTIFRQREGKPEQVIVESAALKLQIVDLTNTVDPEAQLRKELESEVRRPFDLGCAPLARATLLQSAADRHLLLLNVHHLISDAWSQAVFVRELLGCYRAFANREPCPLAPLSIQYADFALWQRELLDSEMGRQHLAFWENQFRNPAEPVLLPTDHPRIRLGAYRGATHFSTLPRPLVDALKEISRREGVTPFMVLLAAFKTLLHRYTGQDRMVVGSPMACREKVEIEGLIGFFVHTQAIQTDLSGNPTFAELLRRVREAVLQAHAHQDIPCQLAMQGLPAQRLAADRAPFQVVFGWQTASPQSWGLPGLTAEKMELETGTSKFDWTVLVTECPDGLHVRSEFNTDLFETASMSRLMHQFEVLLENIARSPGAGIAELALQTTAERDRLIIDWNRTGSDYERSSRIHELFEAQAARSPDAVALVFKGRTLSYSALNRHANALARRLRDIRVGSGVKVGLCVERSFEMIVGMLAILKAGGAYLPLDPGYPTERLRFMLQDCSASVLIIKKGRIADAKLAEQTICLGEEEQPSAADSENLQAGGSAEDPAYVMYTSGSTGTPKGTLIPHRGVVRLVRNTNYLDFSPEHVFLQLAAITFDASTLEIWGPLLNGGRLLILDPQTPSLAELGRTIRENHVTTVWLTAGLFHQMVDHQLEDLRGLKFLLAGGDVLSPAHVSKALLRLQGCQLINGYGPTENTTFTCCYRLPGSWSADQPVPIGRPISNTQVYVLDPFMTPVPVGMPGELYTGGDGLAIEYLNRPELTKEKFVPNPFRTNASEKLYRTGDIVRWLPDGNLEFLRRTDEQVKIRGYRIEPGEVEKALAQHESVSSVVVLARDHERTGKHLVAYVVARTGRAAKPDELKEFLASRLPAYMVPAHITILSAFPLTNNGKIDRRALPAPEFEANSGKAFVPPGTPMEKLVADIWCEVLGRERLGIHEDFFQLGGHSLLATQVISRVGSACNLELPLRALFESPTIAGLAAAIELQTTSPSRVAPVLSRSGPARAAQLLEHLDELTEAELEQLLRDPELKAVL